MHLKNLETLLNNIELKFQQGSSLKYLNLRIIQFPLGKSIDKTDNIINPTRE